VCNGDVIQNGGEESGEDHANIGSFSGKISRVKTEFRSVARASLNPSDPGTQNKGILNYIMASNATRLGATMVVVPKGVYMRVRRRVRVEDMRRVTTRVGANTRTMGKEGEGELKEVDDTITHDLVGHA